MKKNRFKVGDIINSPCGDYGLVLTIGPRPDDNIGKLGVQAHWVKEKLVFWMDLNEPELQLCNDLKKEEQYEC